MKTVKSETIEDVFKDFNVENLVDEIMDKAYKSLFGEESFKKMKAKEVKKAAKKVIKARKKAKRAARWSRMKEIFKKTKGIAISVGLGICFIIGVLYGIFIGVLYGIFKK